MSTFFLGLNPRWQLYRFLPAGLNVMFSAAGFWNNEAKDWRSRQFPHWAGLRFLDPGGFTLLNQFGEYPFSVVALANFVARMRPDFYATMDYPCEPEISRQLGLMTNQERIEATVRNAAELAEWEGQLPGQMVPVIQGHTLEEYEYCLDLYQRAGLMREYMAVGSMCRRISTEELNRLIPGIYRAARSAGAKRLHFFGLKLSVDLTPLSRFIWSRDSAVALDDYSDELRQARGGRRWPRGQQEKEAAFGAFLGRLQGLGLNYANH